MWKNIFRDVSGVEHDGKKFKNEKEVNLYIECVKIGGQIEELLPQEHTTISYRRHGVCPKRFSSLQMRVNLVKYTIDEIKHSMTWEHFEDYYDMFSTLIFTWNQQKISSVVLED